MAESLFAPAFWHVDGARCEASTALASTTSLLFLRDGELGPAPAMTVALPDSALVHATCGVASSVVRFSIEPNWLRFNFAALAWMMRLFRFARRPLAWALAWQLYLLRGLLLRKVESHGLAVDIAIADRGLPSERGCALSFVDGQTATALGVAATVHAWQSLETRPVGLHPVARVIDLERLLAGLAQLGHVPELRWFAASGR